MFASIVETDTTIIVDNKRIDIIDSGNRTKVKVYHLDDDGDFIIVKWFLKDISGWTEI